MKDTSPAPTLPPPRPSPSQALRHQHVAERLAVAGDDPQPAAVAVAVAAAWEGVEIERALGEQGAQAARRLSGEGGFLRAAAADLRRVDIGYADSGAAMDESVAVDHMDG